MPDASALDRNQISSALASFEPHVIEPDVKRRAGVAIVIMRTAAGEFAMPITMRPDKMRAHPGQFALPGGSVDPGETGADAARRELHEELGLRVESSDVLGRLDDYETRSGYVITPFVVWSEESIDSLVPNPDEVAEIYAVGLAEIDVEPRFVRISESPKPVIQWPFRDQLIHAPTGAVVFQFREVVLHGRHTRIDGLEQPVFAWR